MAKNFSNGVLVARLLSREIKAEALAVVILKYVEIGDNGEIVSGLQQMTHSQ